MNTFQNPDSLWFILLGVIGGAVKVFAGWLHQQPNNFREAAFVLFLNCCISGFSGYMGALASSMFTTSDQSQILTAGMFGYLGVAGIDYLSTIIKNKIKS